MSAYRGKRHRRWTFRLSEAESAAAAEAATYVGMSVSALARVAVEAYVATSRKVLDAKGLKPPMSERQRLVAKGLANGSP